MEVPQGIFAAEGITDPESVRYQLGGVQLEPAGSFGRAAATDGRMAIIAQWDRGDLPTEADPLELDGPVIISQAACRAVSARKNGLWPYRWWQAGFSVRKSPNGAASYITIGAEFDDEGWKGLVTRLLEGRFPKIFEHPSGVFGRKPEALRYVRVDLKLLAKLVASLNRMTHGEERVPVYVGFNAEGPDRLIFCAIVTKGCETAELRIAACQTALAGDENRTGLWFPETERATAEKGEDPQA